MIGKLILFSSKQIFRKELAVMAREYFRGFSKEDKPRTMNEWNELRRKLGSRVYNSDIATQLRLRDRQMLGKMRFYAEPEELTQADLHDQRDRIAALEGEIAELTGEKRGIFGQVLEDE